MPTYSELTVGQTAAYSKTINKAEILKFAEITGDYNPIHVDDSVGAASRFGSCIAHGMLTAGLISMVLGTKLPGAGAVYVSQTIRFLNPVRVGDTVTARAELVELIPARRRVRVLTTCTIQDGTIVVDGEAILLIPAES